MIPELVTYLDTQLVSLSKGINLFAYEIPSNVDVDAVVILDGRYGITDSGPRALNKVEILVQSSCKNAKDSKTQVNLIRAALINMANIQVTGVGKITFTGAPTMYIGRDSKNLHAAACALEARYH